MAGVHNNSTLSVDSQCQLWTSNINVNGATVNLNGMTYVADDMTLKGTGSKVTLGKNNKNNNAKYVGFGNGGADKENPVAGDSSAIIINGRRHLLICQISGAYVSRNRIYQYPGYCKLK